MSNFLPFPMNMFSCLDGLSVLRRKAFWAATTLTFFTSSILAPSAFAAELYWRGGTSTIFEAATNWSALPRGTADGTVPGSSDVAIFLSSGSTVRFRSNVNVQGIMLMAGWTGSVLMGTGSLKVGTRGMKVGSGFFIGGYGNTSSGITISATGSGYTQTGGIVSIASPLSTSGSFKVQSTSTKTMRFTSTGTVVFSGSGQVQQFFTSGQGAPRVDARYTGITVQKQPGMASTSNGKLTVSGSVLGLSGALTINRGNFDLTTNSVPMVDDNGAITLANNTGAILTTNSNVTHSGALTVNYNARFTPTAGTWTVIDDGDTTYTLNGPNSGKRFFSLVINNTGGGTNDDVIFAGSGVNLSGNLTVTLGNMDLQTNSQALVVDDGSITVADAAQATFTTNSNVTHSGSLTVNTAGGFTIRNGTWTVIDDSDTTYDMNGGSKHFYNLTLNNSAGTSLDDLTITGTAFNVSGSLTVTLGKLIATSLTARVGSGVTIADSAAAILSTNLIYVGGNWTKYALGTYTHNGGTVNLNGGGTQTLTGSTIFHNLTATTSTARTIQFPQSLTQTISNALTLAGIADNKLTLNRTGGSTAWNILSSGTRDLAYLSVSNSNNLGVTISCGNNCTDGGGNTAWDFASTTTTSSTSGSSGGGGGGGGGGRSRAATAATPAIPAVPATKPAVRAKPAVKKGPALTPKERMEARKAARVAAAAAREARKNARKAKWGM